jgi:hypothetical protein
MKKILILTMAVLLASGSSKDPGTCDEGVEINGVIWATRNVDKPGTFAALPEDPGMLYQWNSKVGWSASDPLWNTGNSNGWECRGMVGDEWSAATDPCPPGWRVPNMAQWELLKDAFGSGPPAFEYWGGDTSHNRVARLGRLIIPHSPMRSTRGTLEHRAAWFSSYWLAPDRGEPDRGLYCSVGVGVVFGNNSWDTGYVHSFIANMCNVKDCCRSQYIVCNAAIAIRCVKK